jgi:hypothetical protein
MVHLWFEKTVDFLFPGNIEFKFSKILLDKFIRISSNQLPHMVPRLVFQFRVIRSSIRNYSHDFGVLGFVQYEIPIHRVESVPVN